MIKDGITPDPNLLFRKAVSRLERTDAVDESIDNVQPQELLNNTVALWSVLMSLTGSKGASWFSDKLLARLISSLFPNGLAKTGTWEASNAPAPGRYGHSGNEPNTLYLGPNQALVHGRLVTLKGPLDHEIALDMPPPPLGGSRSDLVFLESWCQLIDFKTGLGLLDVPESIDDGVVYRYGAIGSTTDPISAVFEDVSALQFDSSDPGDTLRFQWQWRIRIVPGVDFDSHPEGLGAPNVLARAGLEAETGLTFSSAGEGLYRAGDGSGSHQALLQTLDGHVWAIPLFRINRSAGVGVITEGDVIDLRQEISLNVQALAETLFAHIEATGNVHNLKHQELENVLGVNPGSTDTTKNKHVSNADAKRWEDHSREEGNPHKTRFDDLLGLPSAFPPAAHRHPWTEIDNKPSTYPPSPHQQPWDTITNKPSTYPPSPHTHSGEEITSPVNNSHRVGGVKITVSATEPPNPEPYQVWIKIT